MSETTAGVLAQSDDAMSFKPIVTTSSDVCPHRKQKSLCKECGGTGLCVHGKRQVYCKECGGSAYCTHGTIKRNCRPCGGKAFCAHGKRKTICKECGGAAFCTHGKQPSRCKECGGSAICEHDSEKRFCKQCSGTSLCVHNKRPYACKQCQGSAYCTHGKLKYRCTECGGGALCTHGKIKTFCQECGGSGYCTHGKTKATCLDCGGSALCAHGNQRRAYCKECGGSAFCSHGRRKALCKECGGTALCTHGKLKSLCAECGGSALCVHGKRKVSCKACGGSMYCEHGTIKSTCQLCGGSGLCEHGKRKTLCQECGGGSLCIHKKRKSECKNCGGRAVCAHGKVKRFCKDCGGSGICEHKKHKYSCMACKKMKESTTITPVHTRKHSRSDSQTMITNVTERETVVSPPTKKQRTHEHDMNTTKASNAQVSTQQAARSTDTQTIVNVVSSQSSSGVPMLISNGNHTDVSSRHTPIHMSLAPAMSVEPTNMPHLLPSSTVLNNKENMVEGVAGVEDKKIDSVGFSSSCNHDTMTVVPTQTTVDDVCNIVPTTVFTTTMTANTTTTTTTDQDLQTKHSSFSSDHDLDDCLNVVVKQESKEDESEEVKDMVCATMLESLRPRDLDEVTVIKLICSSIQAEDGHIFNEDYAKTRVGPSRLVKTQEGLFAAEDIVEGTLVTWYTGRNHMTLKSAMGGPLLSRDRNPSEYLFDVEHEGRIKYFVDGFTPDLRFGGDQRCLGSYINHHPTDFNTKFAVTKTTVLSTKSSKSNQQLKIPTGAFVYRVAIYATRTILCGEEIYLHYGESYHNHLVAAGVLHV